MLELQFCEHLKRSHDAFFHSLHIAALTQTQKVPNICWSFERLRWTVSTECVQAALPAGPLLVVLLQSSISRQIAEQSAWALGEPHPA